MAITITRTDCTQEFYAHPDTAGFDDWCLSNGIGFECKLIEEHNPNSNFCASYMSYTFEHKGLAFAIQHRYTSAEAAQTAREMLTKHPELIQNIFAVQEKFHATGLDNKPLVIRASTYEECLTRVTEQELRLTQDKMSLLKLYLSKDYICGTTQRPGAFKKAFTFGGVKSAKAYIGDDANGKACLHLVMGIEFLRSGSLHLVSGDVQVQYTPAELKSVINQNWAISGGSINATVMTQKLVRQVREVYQWDRAFSETKETLSLTDLDDKIFMAEDLTVR